MPPSNILFNRRNILAGGMALSVTACGRATQKGVLRSVDTHPDGYPTVEAVKVMSRELFERTGGRLAIKIYPGGQLGEEKDALELTIFGGLDLNRLNIAPLAAIAPALAVPTFPFVFRSVEHMRAAMDGAPGEQMLRALEPHGLIGLCYYDSGARSFYNTKRPILTPDDMAGMKIRVMNSDVAVQMVEALGANATPMNYGEVYQALVQGVVDGAENNWPSFESSRHYEAARYYSRTMHVVAPEVLVMSRHSWERLSVADQDSVREAAKASVPVMRRLWDERVSVSRQRVLDSGKVEVIEQIDQAAFEARVRPVWDRFTVTPEMKRLVEDIQNVREGGAA